MSEKKEIKYVYTKSKDFRNITASGVHGGVSINGNIELDLFLEKHTKPKEGIIEIEGNKMVNERLIPNNINFEREIQIGVMLSPNVAYNIGKWLIEKAESAGFKEK